MNANQIKVRKASSEDLDSLYTMICGLEKAVLDKDAFETIFAQNVKKDRVGYFLAEGEHGPMGMISVHIQGLLHHVALVAEIQEMFVLDQYRSMGVGKVLMQQGIEFAKQNGAIQLEVTSRAYREDAHRFYEREGFEKSHVKLVRYF